MFEPPSRESTRQDHQTKSVKRFQAAEQFLWRGYIPLSKGAWGFECNEVDFGNGRNNQRTEVRRQRSAVEKNGPVTKDA